MRGTAALGVWLVATGASLGCGRVDFQLPPPVDGGPRDATADGDAPSFGEGGTREDAAAPSQSCPSSDTCAFECSGESCRAECGARSTCAVRADGAGAASVECASGASCQVDAAGVAIVEVSCANDAHCDVDCSDATECRVTCGGAARCAVGCVDAGSCEVRCGSSRAECLVHCDGADRCELSGCRSEDRLACVDGSLVCGRSC